MVNRQQHESRREKDRIVGAGVAVIVIGALVTYLFITQGGHVPAPGSVRATPSPPNEEGGAACRYLAEAAASVEAGDREAFEESAMNAGRVARSTLVSAGQVFGPSERAALRLSSALRLSGPRAKEAEARFLSAGADACRRIDRWLGTSETKP
jgi:hypothetical protein